MLLFDIICYSLCTTTHVEDYSYSFEHDNNNSHDNNNNTPPIREEQIDTGKWKQIYQVLQLRWQLCMNTSTTNSTSSSFSPLYGPAEVANLALNSLRRLVELHPPVDYRGVPYFPIPMAKRLLCRQNPSSSSSSSLSVIAQALLCNDSNVVQTAANLLTQLTTHNDVAMSKLYLTGVYFFSLQYTGSDFTP